jgi:hypothetical protein
MNILKDKPEGQTPPKKMKGKLQRKSIKENVTDGILEEIPKGKSVNK